MNLTVHIHAVPAVRSGLEFFDETAPALGNLEFDRCNRFVKRDKGADTAVGLTAPVVSHNAHSNTIKEKN